MPLTYYVACYWHRDCDPSSVAVGLSDTAVTMAIDAAIAEEEESSKDGCATWDEPDHEEDCQFCNPDLVWSGVGQEAAKEVFVSAQELREHRRDLQNGRVVWLARG